MSLPTISSTPTTTSLNLGNGFSTKTTYQYNSSGMPTSIVNDTYQNGTLIEVDTQTFTYNNNVETINWSSDNKTFNYTSSGTFTSTY